MKLGCDHPLFASRNYDQRRPSGRCFFVRANRRGSATPATILLSLHTRFSGFPLDRKGSLGSQWKYVLRSERIPVDPPKAAISVSRLTSSYPLIPVQPGQRRSVSRSPNKGLFALSFVGVGGFGAPAFGQCIDGVSRDDERGGCGSYGKHAGNGRVGQDLPGSQARAG